MGKNTIHTVQFTYFVIDGEKITSPVTIHLEGLSMPHQTAVRGSYQLAKTLSNRAVASGNRTNPALLTEFPFGLFFVQITLRLTKKMQKRVSNQNSGGT